MEYNKVTQFLKNTRENAALYPFEMLNMRNICLVNNTFEFIMFCCRGKIYNPLCFDANMSLFQYRDVQQRYSWAVL